MKRAILIGGIFILALLTLLSLSSTPETSSEVSITEIDTGVVIQNVGSVACLVFISSPEGKQQFELNIGQNTTVTGISQPIEVSVVSLTTGLEDLEKAA